MSATPEAVPPPQRRRIKEMEVMVADVIVETPDTATLVLFTGNDRLDYKAGHFLTIDPHQFDSLERFIAFFEDVKGKKEPPRAYSMTSAPHEKHLAITIKEERYVSGTTKYPPLLSPLLVKRTLRGMRLEITGFTGPYTLPDDIESKTDHLVHLCAGSGSVPNFSILKHALLHHPKLRHTFLYSNKTWDDIIFRDELDAIAHQHPGRVRLLHTLTRETPPPGRIDVRKGRIDSALLRDAIPDPDSCIVYACGPAIGPFDKQAAREKGVDPMPRFLETALAGLVEIGVAKDRIKHESYG
jgi:ferredoxin-NADP reductase